MSAKRSGGEYRTWDGTRAEALTAAQEWCTPEVMLTYGATLPVMLFKAWNAHWGGAFDQRTDFIYSLLSMNGYGFSNLKDLTHNVRKALGCDEKWVTRRIGRAEDLGYVVACRSDGLPAVCGMSERRNDARKVYPLPTEVFIKKYADWSVERSCVLVRVHAMAKHYSRDNIPEDAAVAPEVQWDSVGFHRNKLK